jgi:flagellar motor switch protein FliN/FliY
VSDAPLSQDAIDALLAAAARSAASAEPAPAAASGQAPADPPAAPRASAKVRPAQAPRAAAPGQAPGNPPGGPRASARVRPAQAAAAVAPELEDAVRDLEVELVVVFGETEMTIGDVLRLGPGSIVELEHGAGLPVDIRLAGRTVARGEVVTVDDAYAIRITENLVRPGP